jgi:uridine phosphorylase
MSPNNDAVIIESRRGVQEKTSAPLAIMACNEEDRRRFCRLTSASTGPTRAAYNAHILEVMHANRDITVAGPILGAPQAVLVLEKLIALGSRTVVVLGWCGSLQPLVKIGDLLLPTSARSEEGTSIHYPMNSSQSAPDTVLSARLREHCEMNRLSLHLGPVWTTDAPLRETVAKVRTYGKEGLLAVEMEMSALFHVAAYRKIRLVGLLVVTDELFTLKWRPGFRSNRCKRARHRATEIILDFCAALPPDLLK